MAKKQIKTTAPTPQAQAAGQPLTFDARVYPVSGLKHVLAFANVDINGAFAVRNVKIVNGEKGPFVAMPQFKDKNGEYKDICFPCTKEARQQFNETVLEAYEQKLQQTQSETQGKQDAQEEDPELEPEEDGPVMEQTM